MDYDDFVDSTQDNTQVKRIMNDFQQFLQRQTVSSVASEKYFKEVAENSSLKGDRFLDDKDLSVNIDIKMKLGRIEKQHSSEKQALVKANISLESECAKLNSLLRNLQERCDSLELKNKHLTETNLEMIDKVKFAEETRDDQIAKWKANYEKLERLKQESDKRILSDLSNCEMKYNEIKDHNLSLQNENNHLTSRLEEALSIGKLYNQKITDSAVLAQRHQQTLNELASAKLHIHSLTTRLNDVEDIEKNVQCFKEDMERLRFMEAENKRLLEQNIKFKENQENALLINEKLFSTEHKLSRALEKCNKADELEIENQSLKRRLNDSDYRAKNETLLTQLQDEIAGLQQHMQLMNQRNEILGSNNESLLKKHTEEKRSKFNLTAKIEELTEENTSLKTQLLRLKKRAALLSHERDSIRKILQSYDAELTMTSHTTQLSKRLTNAEDANGKLHARIEQLEGELQKNAEELMRQRLLVKHNVNPDKAKHEEKVAPHSSGNEVLEKEVASLKKNKSDLEKEKEELSEKIEQLETIVERNKIKGGYDPRSEKVFHFTMNPADSARQKLKQDFSNVRKENLELKKKIKELQEGRDVSVSEIEVPQAVRDELAMSELRNKRLKEVFSKKIQEFRQACYSLTGYRIDSSPDSKYKLVSMYAESESDCLLFQMKADGNIELLETEYSKTLQELISLHLHHQNSIPMFLSALSVSLFSQQTMFTE